MSQGWVIIWESRSFNAKGIEPGVYAVLSVANDDCDKLNSNNLSDCRYSVVPVDSPEHTAARTHVFSWRKTNA